MTSDHAAAVPSPAPGNPMTSGRSAQINACAPAWLA
ncbi:hypothetical protein IWX85_000593 [Polaromonas sp. CG_9.11]|nr:hypothetical protein [Polaromonas sp. CG_9.11]